MSSSLPLLVQSDGTLLLDGRHSGYEEVLEVLRPVAELGKRPGHLHTYRMTPVSLWNAAAAGETADSVIANLRRYARYGLPSSVEREIRERMDSFGRFRLVNRPEGLFLSADLPERLRMAYDWPEVVRCFASSPANNEVLVAVEPAMRGALKSALAARGCPIVDEAGYRSGGALSVAFREVSASGKPVKLRAYQREAADAFLARDGIGGGSGVAVLPCGAGKTWVGMAAMVRLGCETLILTPNTMSVSQWIRELLENTTLTEGDIGEYTGTSKQVRPVTVATYQVLTHRRSRSEGYPHWKLFEGRDWGLIVYDEVHLLPAPVFRMTAELQATRRLGLTATLVREDGREMDVFALIGPKTYELSWKRSEREGWIAEASCKEVRVPMADSAIRQYREAPPRARHRIAGENPAKAEVLRRLLARHEGSPTLIIGQYLNQLRRLAEELGLPLVTGEMPHEERRRLFDLFNRGDIGTLIVSKVANFAVDLPDASVAIQVSGSYGSRQEEAQRLGRILRPKPSGGPASFYTLVSEGTDEVEFARNRGRFLVEQGYEYAVDAWQPDAPGGSEGVSV
ncbi:helicase [Cohnella sp. CFH 77786]|uniref:DNA repair helicase XPB n=1 Tax=Cohnella sp. CFH 77786 TaxID=2662265 RepID=UPI001C60D838|nr:DNA repair helicase XPB [Cohnella sp. CFH 77786]MBW5444691.1 helicase [Cohnella sp. CFH 77786]